MHQVHIVEATSILVLGFFIFLARKSEGRHILLLQGATLALGSWIAEDTCIRLYGFYKYVPEWHLFLDQMPLMVAFIWPFVIFSDMRVVEGLLKPGHRWLPWATGLLVCWDAALMETVAVKAGLWSWTEPGLLGVPPIGILGWGFFAATALWLWTHLKGAHKAWTILLAPLLTHILLLMTWWGALRWILRGPINTTWLMASAGTFSLTLSILVLRGRIQIPFITMLPRILSASVFFWLLFAFGRHDGTLVFFIASYIPPYVLATHWPRPWKNASPSHS